MSKDKLYNILLSDDVVTAINDNLDVVLNLIPELKKIIGFDHRHPHHHLDVWNHTLLALNYSPKDFFIRMVLLLHDIGKSYVYQDEEVRHFRGHAKVSSNMSRTILNRLNFDDDYIDKICYLIENHDTKITDEQIKDNYDLCLKLLEIQKSDALAHHPDKLDKRIDYLKETHKKLKYNK